MRCPNRQRVANLFIVLVAVAVVVPGWAAEIRVEHFDPKPIHITVDQLPPPFHSESANRSPQVVPVPRDAVLEVPAGFRVKLFAEVPQARWLALTPSGSVLCAASRENKIVLLQDENRDGVADTRRVFLDKSQGANLPFGMAFAQGWFFLGNTDAVLRYPYSEADGASGKSPQLGKPERIAQLPGQGYHQHWTRNVVAAPGGDKLYVSVGSASNVDREELPRASVLQMNLDGSQREVFAFGLRNPVGLDFHPRTGELYATVNERDGLGDNLVPDYLARLEKGQFYGWPYAYLTPRHLDPRRTKDGRSEQPDLVQRTVTPEVLFESHSAALGLAFYDADAFPKHYHNGAFVAFRGSWNRHQGTGYKLVFVPFDEQGHPKGHYEDFIRGFLLDPAAPKTWGRPVGVLVMPDGSLLFTEEGNGRIYRVWYAG